MTADPTTSRPHRRWQWLWGPAFVAAIAYVDPGNVAANLTAGARYGYRLVWVLVAANTMAMLVQYLSAKLGLVTGQSLPQLLGQRLGRRARWGFFLQAEIVAIATDLAEVIGGALALKILFDLPLFLGGIIVGLVSMFLLTIQHRRGEKVFETVIIGLLLVITIGFLAGLVVSRVDWLAALGGVVPSFSGAESVLLATSMLGATVMPHAVYVHSALTTRQRQSTSASAIGHLLSVTRWDVVASMFVAGAVNIAMLLLAASNLQGNPDTDSIEGAWQAINDRLGSGIGVMFGIGLLASGLASTSVGTFAGATIMSGLTKTKLPLLVIRAITLVPALIILGFAVSPTWALVISQVVLSFGIPFALIPLVRLTGLTSVMGRYANSRGMQAVSWAVISLIVALDLWLVIQTIWS